VRHARSRRDCRATVGGVGYMDYRAVVTGELMPDTGVGRSLRPLGPLEVAVDASRELAIMDDHDELVVSGGELVTQALRLFVHCEIEDHTALLPGSHRSL
jgi:hypothetical protein